MINLESILYFLSLLNRTFQKFDLHRFQLLTNYDFFPGVCKDCESSRPRAPNPRSTLVCELNCTPRRQDREPNPIAFHRVFACPKSSEMYTYIKVNYQNSRFISSLHTVRVHIEIDL